MTLKELTALMDPGESSCFTPWTQDEQLCLGVNRACLDTTLGHFPKRLDFNTQDEFHDAHYQWVSRAKSLAIEMLTNFAKKHGLSSTIEVDAWDKPRLAVK